MPPLYVLSQSSGSLCTLASPRPHISIFSVHCTVSAVAAAPARHLLSPLSFPVLYVVRYMLSCKCGKGTPSVGMEEQMSSALHS